MVLNWMASYAGRVVWSHIRGCTSFAVVHTLATTLSCNAYISREAVYYTVYSAAMATGDRST